MVFHLKRFLLEIRIESGWFKTFDSKIFF